MAFNQKAESQKKSDSLKNEEPQDSEVAATATIAIVAAEVKTEDPEAEKAQDPTPIANLN